MRKRKASATNCGPYDQSSADHVRNSDGGGGRHRRSPSAPPRLAVRPNPRLGWPRRRERSWMPRPTREEVSRASGRRRRGTRIYSARTEARRVVGKGGRRVARARKGAKAA